MKKIFDLLVLTLALNFLLIAGGVGWLFAQHKLDKTSLAAIKQIVFPPAGSDVSATTQPTTEPSTTKPTSQLEELLARHKGSAAVNEQVELIQHSFDAQRVELDQRQRQLEDLQTLIGAAQAKLKTDRAQLEDERKLVADSGQEAARLASDKGFQDTLSLYNTMPPKQVKGIFMGLDDSTAVQYLQAMQPRSAAKILKEFKSPDEAERMRRLMERMRQPQTQPATREAKEP